MTGIGARTQSTHGLASAGLVIAGGVVAVSAAAALAVGVLAGVMARRIVTPPTKRADDTRVFDVDLDAGTITLEATKDAVLPGDYSFWFAGDSGHARLGVIEGRTVTTVTRRILTVDFGNLGAATRGRLGGYSFLGPWDLGLEFSNVTVPTELGDAPAWLIPAAEPSGRWVIQVHGRGVRRHETLRAVPVFNAAGYSCLLVSYRNDGEAPPSADGRFGLGDTEWRDVEAAIDFAVGQGATQIVLMGWSMGGAIALQAATRARHDGRVTGIVLDSPVIDWADVVAYQALMLRLPRAVVRGALVVMGRRWGRMVTGLHLPIDFPRLDFVSRASDLSLPILILHSDDDGYVPSAPSRALAEKRPDIVTLVPFSVARHTKLWNYDPAAWNAAILGWLGTLGSCHPAVTAARDTGDRQAAPGKPGT
ncbi:alpha/beta fold hydrolase [Cryobacterium adonitolivorans]|uniref:Alpha/beta fold hydrolase n=1 Tax=Cryobacterium adonitolivorans TaxID=1259189 RepID=A0A4R8VYG1_9MICO|nr:alpha/beta fold hydrolase [Cryobacterium adonitolivorans]TFB97822.1 alpha/beta fold hydrolase [Cryobacterium adonitolivorans]